MSFSFGGCNNNKNKPSKQTLIELGIELLSFNHHQFPDVLLARFLLSLEEYYRRHPQIQKLFHRANQSGVTDWIAMARNIQKHILLSAGLEWPAGRSFLSRQVSLFPELRECAGYLKFNRLAVCRIQPGQPAVNVPLVCARTLAVKNLFDYNTKKNRPLVVVAGSGT